MTAVQTASLLLVLAAAFGAINYHYLRLPSTIGIFVVTLLASICMLVIDAVIPGLDISQELGNLVKGIDFSRTLMEGMLGLLLFAGALHVKTSDLQAEWPAVLLTATFGVAISTAVVGFGFSWITGMPILIALIFGALISPTDPVAVLGVLREAKLSRSLETKIAGESLFNDGVGYVVFLIFVGLAFPTLNGAHGGEAHGLSVAAALRLFVQEALGGALLGLFLGWITFRVMRRIDDYSLEVLITLALAVGGYSLATAVNVSGPIMAVCAGLLIGDVGSRHGMSETTRQYVDGFWKLIDEILNALLFLLIGFEVFAIAFDLETLPTMIYALALSLVARFLAVVIPLYLLKPLRPFESNVIPIMTWGGLKGGISIALALSLPRNEWTLLILTCTYGIVVFSIIVQGLTVGKLAKSLSTEPTML